MCQVTLMKGQVALSIRILVELINDITGDLKFLNFNLKGQGHSRSYSC